jgi:hypothetical protein
MYGIYQFCTSHTINGKQLVKICIELDNSPQSYYSLSFASKQLFVIPILFGIFACSFYVNI